MHLRELLALDSEFRNDISHFADVLRARRGWEIAGNCLLVSANLMETVEALIQMEFSNYSNERIELHIGNLGKVDGTETEWLWQTSDIADLAKSPGDLPFIPGQGYHAWLTFAGSIIDLTIDYSIRLRDPEEPGPVYFDMTGASHPPGLTYRYHSISRFLAHDLDRYPALTIR